MDTTKSDPFGRWRAKNPKPPKDVEDGMQRLFRLSTTLEDAVDEMELADAWYSGQSERDPDLIKVIAAYGYSRLVSGDWKNIPMDIPEDEREDWSDNSVFLVSVEDIRDWEASIVGEIASKMQENLGHTVELIQWQLDQAVRQLTAYAGQPVSDFAPTQWDEEQVYENEADAEIRHLDAPFELTEKLMCFEHGIEIIRMLMINETAPEFGLPSAEFHAALVSIDSHPVMTALHGIEPTLEAILKLWGGSVMEYSGKPYHRPYDNVAPEQFWWRHRGNPCVARLTRRPRKR